MNFSAMETQGTRSSIRSVATWDTCLAIVGKFFAVLFIIVLVTGGWRMLKVGFIGLCWDLSLHKRPQPYYFIL